MTSKKIIKIKPFKDIWFKDCFHMALIPPVIHNLGNADCLIFNHIWKYGYEENSLFGILKEFGNVYKILNSKGIKCIPHTNQEKDIKGFVKGELNNNNFVIVGVDNYFERIRKDFYNIKHSGHSILINGYDDDTKSFSAIEQPFFYSYEYDICNVNVEDVEKAYMSYREKMNEKGFFYNDLTNATRVNGEIPSACIMGNNPISCLDKDETVRKEYISRLLKFEDEKMNSISSIKSFADDFIKIYSICEGDTPNSSIIMRNLNDLVNMRLLENYVYKELLHEDYILEDLGVEICEIIKTVRSYLAKHMFSHKNNNKHIELSISILNDMADKEIIYYSKLYETIRRFKYGEMRLVQG